MKYSHLVPILTCLIASFGEVSEQEATQFQEEFCGEGQLTAGVRLFGLKADRRDVKRNRNFNVLTAVGFIAALQGIRTLQRGCIWWAAPPCATFVWLSRGSTGRTSTRPQGKREYRCIRIANRIIRRVCYLIEYCRAKQVHFVLENPRSTLLWRYRPLEEALERHGAFHVSVPLGAFGAPTQKRVTLYTTCDWIAALGTPIDQEKRRRLLRIKSRLDLQVVKKYQCKRTGKQKVAGGRDLYATSVYPVQLGLMAALTSG